MYLCVCIYVLVNVYRGQETIQKSMSGKERKF